MTTRRILITGGAGFIGAHLTKLALSAGHQVRILDNLSPQIHGGGTNYRPSPGADFMLGDVTVRGDVARALEAVDTVVHLAAETGTGQSMYEIERYYGLNVQGTASLFDVLANSKTSVRSVVLASSRSVYGEGAYLCRTCHPAGARRFPRSRTVKQLSAGQWDPTCPECTGTLEPTATREDDPVAPASIYAASKLAQEDLVRVACRTLGIAHSILRLQNVFGEGQSLNNPYTGILSIFSTRIRLGRDLPIFEDGRESRDFVHVHDVARAFLFCIAKPSIDGVILNVGSGQPTPLISVARMLQKFLGPGGEPRVTGQFRVGDIRHNFADLSRLHQVTGFLPELSVEDGLQRFCEWVAGEPVPQDSLDRANEELKARDLMA